MIMMSPRNVGPRAAGSWYAKLARRACRLPNLNLSNARSRRSMMLAEKTHRSFSSVGATDPATVPPFTAGGVVIRVGVMIERDARHVGSHSRHPEVRCVAPRGT